MGPFETIVIGGGHSGLTMAARLAQAGQQVLLLEQDARLGGRCGLHSFGGPSDSDAFSVPGLLHETEFLSAAAETTLKLSKYNLQRDALPPRWLSPAVDGPGLLMGGDAEEAACEIARVSSRDAEQYAQYLKFLASVRDVFEPLLTSVPPDLGGGLPALLQAGWANRSLLRRDLMEILRTLPMCVADWLGEWFENEQLKAGLALPALAGEFTGPWSPGTNSLLVLQGCTMGGAVAGGPAAVIDALIEACHAEGVQLRTRCEVVEIRVEGGVAVGVVLADGETLPAKRVIACGDPQTTLTRLIPRTVLHPDAVRRAEQIRTRGTTAKIHYGVRGDVAFAGRGADIERIRIATSLDDLERAFDPVKYGGFARTPALDVFIPTIRRPELAPRGHSVISVMVHFAAWNEASGWAQPARDELAESVRATLTNYLPDLRGRIVAEEVLTPLDLEQRWHLPGGHLDHGERGLDQLLVRPTLECARYATPVRGLYLASSGCFPGGGLTCQPALLAAERVLQD